MSGSDDLDVLLNVQPPPAPPALTRMDEEQLLTYTADCRVVENAHRARRLQAMAELHDRCHAELEEVRRCTGQARFVLTPLQAAGAELTGLLGMAQMTVSCDIDVYAKLSRWFPAYWAQCLSGRLDVGRATVLVEAAETLADPADIPALADLLDRFLARRDDPGAPLVTLTRRQLSAAARYRAKKFAQKDDGQCFNEVFAKRRVTLRLGDNGLAHVSVTGLGTDLLAADHRLTLIAEKLRPGDPQGRTVEQLRADVLVDLLHGRLAVGALTSELEDDATVDGRDPASTFQRRDTVGAYARPVVQVTVPIQTLLGIGSAPGLLCGQTPLPAEVVRRIAADPDSTWYRMLTDEAGDFVHLSTTSYHPTPPIWRTVVARDPVCVWPCCSRPAVRCELDHRVEHPDGATCICNLAPLCKLHHKTKHAEGFSIVRNLDGSHTVHTRYGQTFHNPPAEQPRAEWPADLLILVENTPEYDAYFDAA